MMLVVNHGYKKVPAEYVVKCKSKRSIKDPKKCSCKTCNDCLMTQFVRDWQAIDELYLLESLK